MYKVWVMCTSHASNPEAKEAEGGNKLDTLYTKENKIVATFDSIASFWNVYTHLRRPSAMQAGVFMHYFIDGVKPLWEDE